MSFYVGIDSFSLAISSQLVMVDRAGAMSFSTLWFLRECARNYPIVVRARRSHVTTGLRKGAPLSIMVKMVKLKNMERFNKEILHQSRRFLMKKLQSLLMKQLQMPEYIEQVLGEPVCSPSLFLKMQIPLFNKEAQRSLTLFSINSTHVNVIII